MFNSLLICQSQVRQAECNDYGSDQLLVAIFQLHIIASRSMTTPLILVGH